MHVRDSQNAAIQKTIKVAAVALPAIQRTAEGAARVAPVPPQTGDVLRAGVQNIGDAVLGK